MRSVRPGLLSESGRRRPVLYRRRRSDFRREVLRCLCHQPAGAGNALRYYGMRSCWAMSPRINGRKVRRCSRNKARRKTALTIRARPEHGHLPMCGTSGTGRGNQSADITTVSGGKNYASAPTRDAGPLPVHISLREMVIGRNAGPYAEREVYGPSGRFLVSKVSVHPAAQQGRQCEADQRRDQGRDGDLAEHVAVDANRLGGMEMTAAPSSDPR